MSTVSYAGYVFKSFLLALMFFGVHFDRLGDDLFFNLLCSVLGRSFLAENLDFHYEKAYQILSFHHSIFL